MSGSCAEFPAGCERLIQNALFARSPAVFLHSPATLCSLTRRFAPRKADPERSVRSLSCRFLPLSRHSLLPSSSLRAAPLTLASLARLSRGLLLETSLRSYSSPRRRRTWPTSRWATATGWSERRLVTLRSCQGEEYKRSSMALNLALLSSLPPGRSRAARSEHPGFRASALLRRISTYFGNTAAPLYSRVCA